MKDISNIKATSLRKKVLILLTSALLAVSLCITSILIFGSDRSVKVPVDEVTSGEVATSATYTNTGSGSFVGTINNGDVINITTTGQNVRSYTLPKGTYTFDLYGAMGGGRGSDNGGKGGRVCVTYTVTAASQLFYFSVGGKGTNAQATRDGNNDSVRYSGGVNGGGTGSGIGGPGGGGGTDIRTGGSGTGNRILVAAGGGGGDSTSYTQTFSSSGTLYQGASGCSSRHSASFSNDEGGGGGGYYGGAVRHSDDAYSSYSGSNYVGAGTATVNSLGINSGNGKIIITVVSVNTAPTAKVSGGYTYNNTTTTASVNTYRGTGKAINIAVSTIATDDSSQTLYYTTGAATDSYPTANNTYVYLNSTGTTLATNYIDWKWTSSTNLQITAIKRYPRVNVDGCTANGKLTLYVRVRDNYGSSASTRANAFIPFHITVNDYGITVKNKTSTPTRYTGKGTAPNTYEYRLGMSNNTVKTTDFISNTNAVYGTNTTTPTVFVPQPLTTGHPGFTITASDLFSTSDSTYDTVGIKSVASSSYTTYYSIAYNSGVSGVYSSITIKPSSARPTSAIFVTLQITAQKYEKATNAVIGGSNTELYLTFKIANTRPYYASNTLWNSGNTAEPYIELAVGQSKDISIGSFLYDPDGTTPTFITSGSANSFIKVPTNEYVSVTRDNSVLTLKSGTNYNRYSGALPSTTWESGEGNVATGFKARTLAATGSAAASTACVTYSYPNNTTLRLTGRAATQYQYGATGRRGDFYILVRVNDPGETTDTGIWYPIAVKVTDTAPKEPSMTASFDLSFNAGIGESAPVGVTTYLTPISYTDAGGVLRGIGTTDPNTVSNANNQVLPFVTDIDVFSYATANQHVGELNDIITINGTTEAAALILNNTQQFFKVELVDLYASSAVFANYKNALNSSGRITKHTDAVYKFKGLKVTPLRATDNYYYEIGVKTIDSLGQANGNVRVFFKVANKAVRARSSSSDSLYPYNVGSAHGTVVGSTTLDYDINYSVEKQDVIYITPYDLAYDFDTQYATLNGNTNPYDSDFATAQSAINAAYSVKRLASVGSSSVQAATAQVKVQQLSFTGREAFESLAAQFSSYFTAEMVTSVTTQSGTTYNVPAIKITAVGRTTANLPVLRLTISDGYSSVTVNVAVTVRNAAPKLKAVGNVLHSVVAGTPLAGSEYRNARDFDIGTYVEDIDNDTPSFVAGTVRVVARVSDADGEYVYTSLLDSNFAAASVDDAVYDLENYIHAVLTKDNLGNDIIRMSGLSSTQLFPVPIFLEFKVDDGYRADPQRPTLRIPVEVINTNPEFVSSELTERESGGHSWYVKVENMPQKALPRYIVNCPELYNSSTAISAAPTNKILLFSDADARQRVMLNPKNGLPAQTNQTIINNLVSVYTGGKITADTFSFAAYENAAVLYTPTYENNATLDISVIFYKEEDGRIRALSATEGTSDMWAIKIVDSTNTNDTGIATQIAIAIADDHNGNDIYRQGEIVGQGNSAVVVDTFYYQYQQLGITAMHEYYRTDGNAESSTAIVGVDGTATGEFSVSYDKLYGYQFADGVKPTVVDNDKQKTLAAAQFGDDFKYQYFVNTTTKVINGQSTAVMAPKTYAQNSSAAFYYKAIEVAGGNENAANTATLMPISYIAMPSIYNLTEGTENSTHVTFANVGGSSVLKDGAYLDWGTTGNKSGDSTAHTSAWATSTQRAVFENLSLTDGHETWSGALPVSDPMYITNNPYIEIKYIASTDLAAFGLTSGNTDSLINQFRANLTESGDYSYSNDWKDVYGASKFREDRFGFSFTKKKRNDSSANQTGKRFAGSLKFTVNLKTSDEGAATQPVSVDINLKDSEPTSFKVGGATSEATNLVEASASLNMSNSGGVTFKLVYGDPRTNEIGYRDPDTTDEARFFMPSASNMELQQVMSDEEIAHLWAGGRRSYYTSVASEDDLATFVPNPGYENFFSISPTGGTSTSLQIIPNAKTALNIPSDFAQRQKYLQDNNLVAEGNRVYYPFRVLIYDDLDDTGFTNGFYMPVLIKVYINNDPLTFTGKTMYGGTGEHARAGKYEFTLVKGVAQSVDVSSFLSDNDMVMLGQSLAVKPADLDYTGGGSDVKENQYLVKDYLVMPEEGDYEVLRGATAGSLPIVVTNSADSSIISFSAQSAFKNEIDLLFKFKDSDPATTAFVEVVITVKYVNERPSVNTDTFGGATSFNIVMKTNDYFTLYAADASKFYVDGYGLFKSPAAFDTKNASAGVDAYPANDNSDPDNNTSDYLSAAQLLNSFKKFTTQTYPTSDPNTHQSITNIGNLGALVVASDDAPSTLRFLTNVTGKPVGTFSSNSDLFDVAIVNGSRLPTEEVLSGNNPVYNPNTDAPMAVKITAKGVVDNVRYVVSVFDHMNVRTDITFNITVMSTAPTLATGTEYNFPRGLSVAPAGSDYRFMTSLKYNGSIEFALNTLVSDVDRGDSSRFVIPDAYDGAQFKIEHPSGVSAISAESVSRVGTDYIRITATDFIPVAGDNGYSKVTFRVSDPHGIQSDEITIGVFVYPEDMTSNAATVGTKRTLALGSYADFADNGERTEYSLIASTAAASTLFVDPDYNSLSAVYNVTVYALYDVDENGSVRGITVSQLDLDNYYDNHVILRRTQQLGGTAPETYVPDNSRVFDYVSNFITMDVSADGRSITFTPVSATIPGDNNGRTVTPLNFYVTVAKNYARTVDGSTSYTLDPVGAYLDVSVANSAPVAVLNSAINYGYPQVERGVARVSDFLSFTGAAGDELTWSLYNTDPEYDENFGLFYDYDQINNPTGNETLTYSNYTILNRYEYGEGENRLTINTARDAVTPEIAATGPVLTVTETQGKVTIKINRKVRIAQPTSSAPAEAYSYIPVEISCIDTLGSRATAAARTVAKTVIIVCVQNDTPDFKEVADQDRRLGYTVTYNELTGEYDLAATVKTGDKLTINYRDIVSDADFDMDAYFFARLSTINATTTTLRADSGEEDVFTFAAGLPTNNRYGISTVSSISFTCTSSSRGAVARSVLILCDSTINAQTGKLNIVLTVGNTAPKPKSDEEVVINLIGKTHKPPAGVSEEAWNSDYSAAATYNILEFMTDINPDDAIDMETYPDVNAENRPYTYMFIDNIVAYTVESEINKPLLTGPAAISGNDKGEPYEQACVVSWSTRVDQPNFNYSHQYFDIVLSPGLYGTQKVVLTVTDSGYLDGAMNYVYDGASYELTLTIVIARPIQEIESPTFDIANRVTRQLTSELLLNTAEEPHNADGYYITGISLPADSPLEVIETTAAAQANGVMPLAEGSTWAIKALRKQADATMTVVFNNDPEHNSKTFAVNILDNKAPVMRDIENIGIFQTSELNEKFMITITPERWFTDSDIEDVMSFNSATVKVASYAEAHIDGRNIVLLFKGRGTTELTLGIQDLSGVVYTHTVIIGCSDMAELSAWNAIMASIQSNVILYAIIAGGVLLLIILLIIIIAVVHKKRKMRREIEALLDSEAELEEEMLRLSAAGMSPYQSYGYLPPTAQTMNDPGLMLGSAQGNPTPNSLQLGAGTGQTTGAATNVPPTAQPITQNIPVTPQQPQQTPPPSDGFDPNSF